MTPTTEQLKDLLLLYEQESVAGAFAVCDLSALAPTLAAEVVRLRSALGLIADLCDDKVMRTVARQALDATSEK